jgi:hypothetical protein
VEGAVARLLEDNVVLADDDVGVQLRLLISLVDQAGGDCRNDQPHDAGVASVRADEVQRMNDKRPAFAADFGEFVDARQDFPAARRGDR